MPPRRRSVFGCMLPEMLNMSNSRHRGLGGILNFIQLYIGYIGGSRAYGMHLEIMDVALFLTNQGVTIYWGHAHRWSRKWRIKAPASVQAPKPGIAVAQVRAGANRPQVAASTGGLLGTDTAAGLSPASIAPGYAPAFSVVPLRSAKAAKSSRVPAPPPDRARDGTRERAPAKVMAG